MILSVTPAPLLADTDGDGLTDDYEAGVLYTDKNRHTFWKVRSNPRMVDSDGDGLNDKIELVDEGTNPRRGTGSRLAILTLTSGIRKDPKTGVLFSLTVLPPLQKRGCCKPAILQGRNPRKSAQYGKYSF